MTLENSELSRRKLLRTTAIGVPAAGLLAFGSTLVTATSANAVDVDGYWGFGDLDQVSEISECLSECWIGR